MDKDQMKMVGVKSTIERMIQAMIAAYEPQKDPDAFFTAVERMVAGLFASQQIDNNYLVRPAGRSVEVSFSAGGHCSRLTYMLPPSLEWKPKIKAKPVAESTGPFTEAEREMANSFDGSEALERAHAQRAAAARITAPVNVYTAGAAGGGGGSSCNYAWTGVLGSDGKTYELDHLPVATQIDVAAMPEFPEPKAVTNRALEAYEKAKKAVEQM